MAFPGPIDLTRVVELIGVPLDYGAATKGVRFGPKALREAGAKARIEALGYQVHDLGDVAVPAIDADESGGPGKPRLVDPIRRTCGALADAVEQSLAGGGFPIVLGGDHSLAVGALAGVARVKGPQGLIWIDAHGDMNTPETSPTGNLHGMALALALGDARALFDGPVFPLPAVDPERCAFIGLRDLDPGEKRAIIAHGLAHFTMYDVDRMGLAKVMERAIDIASGGGKPASAHISVDIDAMDPTVAPGTGTRVPGGLTFREGHLALEMIAESGIAHSIELVEVNPTLDDGTTTAALGVELLCSAMGRSIL